MIKDVIDDAKKRMTRAIDSLHRELGKVRTGRATTTILDGVLVDYYGAMTPINQMATLSVPESRLIMITPWDSSVIALIEKAILKSDLGLNPNSDGKVIRLAFPPLTEDRRREMVKLVRKMGEDAKIAIRNVRREANDLLRDLEKEKEISEDGLKRSQDEVQGITDEYIKKIDSIIKGKEVDVMEI